MHAGTAAPRIARTFSRVCIIACFSGLFCTIALSSQAPATSPAQQNGPSFPTGVVAYRIGPGDDLSVTFPYNSELNHDGPVGPDGRFALPFVGELPLSGMTIADATVAISKSLLDQGIVANAYPSVTILKYSLNIFVGGEVKTPGVIQLSSGMDALQAVFVAGGMLETAKTGHVAIIRRSADNTSKVIYLDLNGYTRGKTAATTAMLEPHDVIFVPRSSIAEVDRWVDDYINRTIPFQRNLNYNAGTSGATSVIQ